MRWVQCRSTVELLGQREGHCATTLTVSYPCRSENNKDSGSDGATTGNTTTATSFSSAGTYVVVFGGYCEGELSGTPIIAAVGDLPRRLRWRALPHQAPLEVDGASLTAVSPTAALLFGGLDPDVELVGCVHSVRLVAASGGGGGVDPAAEGCRDGRTALQKQRQQRPPLPALVVTRLETAGDAPPPRSRHGAGASGGALFIFGGETDDREQTSDLFALDTATLVWRRVATTDPALAPPPRLLSLSLVFVSPTVLVLYGGCHYADGRVHSFDDVWAYYLDRDGWRRLEGSDSSGGGGGGGGASPFPRCNGHRGCLVGRLSTSSAAAAAAAVFIGGKDIHTGDNRVRVVRYAAGQDTFTFELETPEDDGDDGDAAGGEASDDSSDDEEEDPAEEVNVNSLLRHPHWRYTPAVVEVPGGLLVVGGQCRHPQRPSAYLLQL